MQYTYRFESTVKVEASVSREYMDREIIDDVNGLPSINLKDLFESAGGSDYKTLSETRLRYIKLLYLKDLLERKKMTNMPLHAYLKENTVSYVESKVDAV